MAFKLKNILRVSSHFRTILMRAFYAGMLQPMLFAFSFAVFSQNRPPVYPPNVSNIESLKKMVEPLMKMSVEDVIAQVPPGSGIYFVGCPNCNGGAQEGGVLGWK